MSDLLPIVAGCRALVMPPDCPSFEVGVVQFVGVGYRCASYGWNSKYGRIWKIDTPCVMMGVFGQLVPNIYHIPELIMMRIDGGIPEKSEVRESVTA